MCESELWGTMKTVWFTEKKTEIKPPQNKAVQITLVSDGKVMKLPLSLI